MKKIISILLAVITILSVSVTTFAASDSTGISCQFISKHDNLNEKLKYEPFYGDDSIENDEIYTQENADSDIIPSFNNALYALGTTIIQFGFLAPAAIIIIFISLPVRFIGSIFYKKSNPPVQPAF